jgi:hypothetical protein
MFYLLRDHHFYSYSSYSKMQQYHGPIATFAAKILYNRLQFLHSLNISLHVFLLPFHVSLAISLQHFHSFPPILHPTSPMFDSIGYIIFSWYPWDPSLVLSHHLGLDNNSSDNKISKSLLGDDVRLHILHRRWTIAV